MTQFLLTFRHPTGDRSELRDTNHHGEPYMDGLALVDGATILVRGVEWLVTRGDLEDGLLHFVCSPVEN